VEIKSLKGRSWSSETVPFYGPSVTFSITGLLLPSNHVSVLRRLQEVTFSIISASLYSPSPLVSAWLQ